LRAINHKLENLEQEGDEGEGSDSTEANEKDVPTGKNFIIS